MVKTRSFFAKVHGKVQALKAKKKYSEPKIYTGGVDVNQGNKLSEEEKKKALSKSWYVYFSFQPVPWRLKVS